MIAKVSYKDAVRDLAKLYKRLGVMRPVAKAKDVIRKMGMKFEKEDA